MSCWRRPRDNQESRFDKHKNISFLSSFDFLRLKKEQTLLTMTCHWKALHRIRRHCLTLEPSIILKYYANHPTYAEGTGWQSLHNIVYPNIFSLTVPRNREMPCTNDSCFKTCKKKDTGWLHRRGQPDMNVIALKDQELLSHPDLWGEARPS